MTSVTTTPDRAAVLLADAFAELGLRHSAGYRLLNEGRLRAKKVGRRTIVLRDDLNKFIDSLPDYTPGRPQTVRRTGSRNRERGRCVHD